MRLPGRSLLAGLLLASGVALGQHPPDAQRPPGAGATLEASVREVSSASVTVTWSAVPGATAVRVYLAPEPGRPGEAMPCEVLVATLAPTASGYRLARLAPAADVFLRVEVDAAGTRRTRVLHARTGGGPRATLDGPVREVHGYAPDVLMLVLAGGTGSTWQAGPWTVHRRDGTALPVVRVHRQSIPVSAPEYTLGYGHAYRDDVLAVDHRVYLVLASPVGSQEVLHIEGPAGVDLTLPFSDRYLETPVIQLNQVGYSPRATRRWAYVSGWMGTGGALGLALFPPAAEVLAEPTDPLAPRAAVVRALPIAPRAARDPDAGTEVREIDLASVPPAEGVRYRVRIPGVGVSWPTAVSERAVFRAFYVIARGLFLNRWGTELRADRTEWSRPMDHGTVFTGEQSDFREFNPASTPHRGARRLVGGYHDAGDFDQRPTHTVVPQLLLRAFELDPGRYGDGQLTLPESGNGIPDLLDEALWGVAAWEQLQEPDGGVRDGVETWRHPCGFYHASDDPLPYWTYARDPNVTARAAGLFAQAARLVGPFDRARATALGARAQRAWSYAAEHHAAAVYRLYAAGELYRLTGEANYRAAFESAWSSIGPYGAFSRFADSHLALADYVDVHRAMPDYVLGYLGAARATPALVETGRTWLTRMADGAVAQTLAEHAHRNPRPNEHDMDWGHGTAVGRYLDPLVACLQLGDLPRDARQRYLDALSLAADYLLGGNPNGYVYVTGLGSRHVEEPLHLDSLAFAREGRGPMPGIPVYGPVASLPQVAWIEATRRAFEPAFDALPPGLRYADVRTAVSTNEFSVWEIQAPEAQLLALLVGPGMSPPAAWLPGGTEHRSPLP